MKSTNMSRLTSETKNDDVMIKADVGYMFSKASAAFSGRNDSESHTDHSVSKEEDSLYFLGSEPKGESLTLAPTDRAAVVSAVTRSVCNTLPDHPLRSEIAQECHAFMRTNEMCFGEIPETPDAESGYDSVVLALFQMKTYRHCKYAGLGHAGVKMNPSAEWDPKWEDFKSEIVETNSTNPECKQDCVRRNCSVVSFHDGVCRMCFPKRVQGHSLSFPSFPGTLEDRKFQCESLARGGGPAAVSFDPIENECFVLMNHHYDNKHCFAAVQPCRNNENCQTHFMEPPGRLDPKAKNSDPFFFPMFSNTKILGNPIAGELVSVHPKESASLSDNEKLGLCESLNDPVSARPLIEKLVKNAAKKCRPHCLNKGDCNAIMVRILYDFEPKCRKREQVVQYLFKEALSSMSNDSSDQFMNQLNETIWQIFPNGTWNEQFLDQIARDEGLGSTLIGDVKAICYYYNWHDVILSEDTVADCMTDVNKCSILKGGVVPIGNF